MAEPVRDFKGTDDGEWAVEDGDFAFAAGAEAVPQGIRIRVGMVLGECELDEELGVDWVNQIMVKNPNPLVVRSLIGAAIADTPDVTNVIGAQLVQPDDGSRDASIAYQADTSYAEEPITGSIEAP